MFADAESGPTPLTLLRAPAGYGKTTTVVQWLNRPEMAHFEQIWLRCSKIEEDTERFWTLLAEALGRSDTCRELVASAREWGLTEREVVERAVEQLDAPTMIVVDDYQLATSPRLDLALVELLELSDNLFLSVLSRRTDCLDGPLFASLIPTTYIGVEQLAFTSDEVREFAALHGVDPDSVPGSITKLTGGWASALSALIRGLQEGQSRPQLQAMQGRFVRQQLDMVTELEARNVLAHIHLCELIDLPTLDFALERPDGQVLDAIAALEERGLVQQEWFPSGIRYRVNPLLEPSIEQLGLPRLDSEELVEVRRRHAMGLAGDDPDTALVHLLQIADYRMAQQVLISNYLPVLENPARFAELLRWVPHEDLKKYRILASAHFLLELRDPRTPPSVLKKLHASLRETASRDGENGDPEAAVLALTALLVAARMRGNTSDTLKIARELERKALGLKHPDGALIDGSMSFVFAAVGLTGLLNGDVALAKRGYLHSLEWSQTQFDEGEQVRAWSGLAATAAASGFLQEARDYLVRAEQAIRASGIKGSNLALMNRMTAQALLAAEDGNAEWFHSILEAIEPHLERAEQAPIVALAEAHVARVTHGADAALEVLRRRLPQLEAVFHTTPYMRATLVSTRVDLATYIGGYTGAKKILEKLPAEHPVVRLSTARLELYSGNNGAAEEIARRLLRENLSLRRKAEISLILAVTRWEAGDLEQVVEMLGPAVRLSHDYGGSAVYGTVPQSVLVDALQGAIAWLTERGDTVGERDHKLLLEMVQNLPETLVTKRFEALSIAEMRTLRALVDFGTRAEIAEALFVSENTVKFHLRGIYRKLEVSNRADAIKAARSKFLIDK